MAEKDASPCHIVIATMIGVGTDLHFLLLYNFSKYVCIFQCRYNIVSIDSYCGCPWKGKYQVSDTENGATKCGRLFQSILDLIWKQLSKCNCMQVHGQMHSLPAKGRDPGVEADTSALIAFQVSCVRCCGFHGAWRDSEDISCCLLLLFFFLTTTK